MNSQPSLRTPPTTSFRSKSTTRISLHPPVASRRGDEEEEVGRREEEGGRREEGGGREDVAGRREGVLVKKGGGEGGGE